MTEIQHLKLTLEKLVCLHKLMANNKGDSGEAHCIRDDLYDYRKLLSYEDRDWLMEFSESLHELVNKE